MGADIITRWVLKDEVSATAGKIKKSVTDAGKTVKGSVLTGVGLGVGIDAWGMLRQGIGYATDELQKATQAAIADEASQARLYTALQQNAEGWDGNRDAIEGAMRENIKYAFSVDEQRDSLARLVARTGDLNEALGIQESAMNLARLRGISLASASEAISKAMGGEKELLRGLGIEVSKTASSYEVLEEIRKKTAGQKEAYAESAAGTFESLRLTLDQLTEDIAVQLLPHLVTLARVLRDDVMPTVDQVATGFDWLTHAIDPVGSAMRDARDGMERIRAEVEQQKWDKITEGAAAWDTYAESNAAAREGMERMKATTGPFVADIDVLTKHIRDMGDSFATSADKADDYRDSIIDAMTEVADRAREPAELRVELDNLNATLADQRQLLKDQKTEYRELKALGKPTAEIEAGMRETKVAIDRTNTSIATTTMRLGLLNGVQVDDLAAALRFLKVNRVDPLSAAARETLRLFTLIGSRGSVSGPGVNRRALASGGPVWPGETVTVGEEGKETLVMGRGGGGYVIPNNGGGSNGAGGAPVVLQVTLDGRVITEVVDRNLAYLRRTAPGAAPGVR